MRALSLSLLSVLVVGCTERNPNFCSSDADCAGTPQPFCDVNGEFAESNGNRNICIPRPEDCPIERCGCTPGEGLACDVDQLTVCAADGRSTETETCALGCSTEDRCLTFEPRNGLGDALAMAAGEPDVVIPAGSTLDTETGIVRDGNGGTVSVTTMMVPQAGAPALRVLLGGSVRIEGLTVSGSPGLAVVAADEVVVTGLIDASANGLQRGPGALETAAACIGGQTQEQTGGLVFAPGAGGAGNATPGGAGDGYGGPGGLAGVAQFGVEPLAGGCRGGNIRSLANNADVATGGGGGGAIQLVAGSEVAFLASGFIHVGGGGGTNGGGGGSGGLLLIESPSVRFDGGATGVTANGGSGGGCGSSGSDATPTLMAALAPRSNGCPSLPGDGATGSVAPQAGSSGCTGTCLVAGLGGGGGGAAGRVAVFTKDGTADFVGSPRVSATVTTGMLQAR